MPEVPYVAETSTDAPESFEHDVATLCPGLVVHRSGFELGIVPVAAGHSVNAKIDSVCVCVNAGNAIVESAPAQGRICRGPGGAMQLLSNVCSLNILTTTSVHSRATS